MVSLGDEGWMVSGGDGSCPYQGQEGVDFVGNLDIETLDFGTVHLYPESWGQTANLNNFNTGWIETHAVACASAGKPCILEEFGYRADVSILSGWQKTALASSGIAGDRTMFWQYGDTLSYGKSSDDGNTVDYGTSNYTLLVTDHVAAIDGGNATTS